MGAKVAFQIMSHWQLISSTTAYVHDNTDCGASQSQTGEAAAGKEFRNIFFLSLNELICISNLQKVTQMQEVVEISCRKLRRGKKTLG